MAEVTVAELAKSVNVSVEHLLQQMKEAGLVHKKAEQVVSDEDKQVLLSHLRTSHGEESDAPQRITLKRRTITKLKTASAGRRTVNVEIRKKRTYVKRDADDQGEQIEEEDEILDTAVAEAEEAQPEVQAEAPLEEPQAKSRELPEPEPQVDEPAPLEAPRRDDKRHIDPECCARAAATAARKRKPRSVAGAKRSPRPRNRRKKMRRASEPSLRRVRVPMNRRPSLPVRLARNPRRTANPPKAVAAVSPRWMTTSRARKASRLPGTVMVHCSSRVRSRCPNRMPKPRKPRHCVVSARTVIYDPIMPNISNTASSCRRTKWYTK
ncbi:MAG: translation initiation factor IF-2 associated domain-containing protein [Gammaproteobacteria bacterium]|nr:translation initiation factor IF-2 associated domain-containing protein [Gammaproteobacteria bacterium]